jgi:cytochrome c-type biogenesis protein CcmH/NrfG
MQAEIKRLVPHANAARVVLKLKSGNARRRLHLSLLLIGLFALLSTGRVLAQDRTYRVWGDVKIDDSKADTPAPLSLTVIIYNSSGSMVGRQTVTNNGRYRFTVMLPRGDDNNMLQSVSYEIAIESDSGEIARVPIVINGPSGSDYRQDFDFQWKSKNASPKTAPGVISAANMYNRSAANKPLFQKAQEAVEKKKYDQAVPLLQQIVATDKLDFPAWTLLGTIYVVQEKFPDAEKAYMSAIEAKPTLIMALMGLGRLRASQKRFEEAIEPLTRAVEAQPESADANLLLGEAYLQIRKGSKAIPYMNEAARLGRAEAHLRLAWLYNAAGMKDKAAVEYEEFLKKKPDYADRKKLEDYISANRKG